MPWPSKDPATYLADQANVPRHGAEWAAARESEPPPPWWLRVSANLPAIALLVDEVPREVKLVVWLWVSLNGWILTVWWRRRRERDQLGV